MRKLYWVFYSHNNTLAKCMVASHTAEQAQHNGTVLAERQHPGEEVVVIKTIEEALR